jgi:ubiquinone/menaquinone biosynthesis C-methylase UbiE
MSTFVLMKLLESAPERYDRGIHLLFGGLVDRVYREIADRAAAPGARILDIGCGTGSLTLACASRGARVVGIDRNAAMLEAAGSKAVDPEIRPRIEWVELGAAEIGDRFPEGSFDAIVSCLAFSELYPEEQAYVLDVARSRLRDGGALVIADEIRPGPGVARLWKGLRRAPAAALTWLLTQTTTRPVDHLEERVCAAGFVRVSTRQLPGDLAIVQGWRS